MAIPLAQQPQIFEAFFQAEDSDTRRHGGTGIGLTIAHKLVRLMGGDVTVESSDGEGAAFHIRLPHRRGAPVTPEPVPLQRASAASS